MTNTKTTLPADYGFFAIVARWPLDSQRTGVHLSLNKPYHI